MKRLCLAFFTLLFSLSAYSQEYKYAAGIRLGDPTGLSFKGFIDERHSIELIAGTVSRSINSRYYENTFKNHYNRAAFKYYDHRVSDIFYAQARFIWERDIDLEGLPGALGWYWGAGAVFKSSKVTYVYETKQAPYYEFIDRRTDIDLGPEALIGMGYRLPSIPLSFYLELGLLIELTDVAGELRTLSAIGLRYQF